MGSTLTIVLLAIVVGVVQLAAGIIIGRCAPFGERKDRSVDPARLTLFARRLCQMASRMASDVGEHKTQMEQVNRELRTLASADSPMLTKVVLGTIAEVMEINDRLQNRLSAAETKLQQQARQMESHITAARTDPLTTLPNRRAFDDELLRRLAEWNRKRNSFCLLMIDVDHFKSLNDRYGHPAGDQVLRSLAEVLRGTAREMDMVARIGGEEFAAILPSTSAQEGRQATERILAAVAAAPIRVDQKELKVTVSLGLAAVTAGDDHTRLISRADEALYMSKHAGRNCGHFHNGVTCEPIRWNAGVAPASVAHEAPPPADSPATDGSELLQAVSDLRSRLAEMADE
jgi:diguanylate cyclase